MIFYPGFKSKEERYEFFYRISSRLKNSIPYPLNDFEDKTGNEDGWMRLTYPKRGTDKRFPGASYELHFVKSSKAHKLFFRKEVKTVLLFYFGRNEKKKNARLEAIQRFSKQINEQFGESIIIDFWVGKSIIWPALGVCLDRYDLGTDADRYTPIVARFIEATFEPVRRVYEEVG